jgi:acyl carrier protein
MNFPRTEVKKIAVKCLQEIAGNQGPVKVNEQTDPILDMGLDSADGILFALELETRFNIELPCDLNPLVDDIRHCSRKIGEIVDLLANLIGKKREKIHV